MVGIMARRLLDHPPAATSAPIDALPVAEAFGARQRPKGVARGYYVSEKVVGNFRNRYPLVMLVARTFRKAQR
jgi:hypothetical protein